MAGIRVALSVLTACALLACGRNGAEPGRGSGTRESSRWPLAPSVELRDARLTKVELVDNPQKTAALPKALEFTTISSDPGDAAFRVTATAASGDGAAAFLGSVFALQPVSQASRSVVLIVPIPPLAVDGEIEATFTYMDGALRTRAQTTRKVRLRGGVEILR
jgi:hypothetical protein